MNNKDDFFAEFEKNYIGANDCINISPDFAENTMNLVFGRKTKKTVSFKKVFTVLAAAMLICALFAGSVIAVGVAVGEHLARTKFSNDTHYTSNTDKYVTTINQSNTFEGLTLVMTEAVHENEKLSIKFDFYYEDGRELNDDGISTYKGSHLTVDGHNYHHQATGFSGSSGTVGWMTMEFDLSDLHLVGMHDFEVSIDILSIFHQNGKSENIYGPWNYSFSLDAGNLHDETFIFDVDRTITLYNGDTVYVDRIVCTPISQRLYFTAQSSVKPHNPFYFVYAYDRLGRCEFSFDNMTANKGESINQRPDYFDYNAETLTLTFYVRDGTGKELADPIELTVGRMEE